MVILAAGLAMRRRRSVHWKLMATAFAIDVALVLIIELSRGAVETSMATTSPLMLFHIAVSIGTLAGYGVLIYLGRRLFRGDETARVWHWRAATVFVVMRTLNYVTSFMVV